MMHIQLGHRKLVGFSVVASVLLLYGLFLAHLLDITNADIGRHIRNGEIIINNFEMIRTNLYSFPHPELQTVNHHWGSGVLFYLAWKLSGFIGLHLFFIMLSLLAFGIFYTMAVQQAGLGLASLLSIFTIPLLAQRTEIRPEVFSYLLAGLFWWELLRFRQGSIPAKRLLVTLPLLEILWVNLHIYFLLGPAIVGAFVLETMIIDRKSTRNVFLLLVLTSMATLCNPFGVDGALAPLRIFDNYEFAVLENEPVWYIDQIFPFTHTLFFKIEAVLVIASFLLAIRHRPKEISLAHGMLALFSLAAGGLAVRNFALSGLFALPILSTNLSLSKSLLRNVTEQHLRVVALALLLPAMAFVWWFYPTELFPFAKGDRGIGLKPNSSAAAEYIKNHGLRGPIFNNYDIGGYLIFHLYPRERVFVDGRPEAYPADFFGTVYMPMLMSESKWQKFDKTTYHFNMIVLDHRDLSPWTQQFLRNRLNDPEWANVYADSAVAIFVRNQGQIEPPRNTHDPQRLH